MAVTVTVTVTVAVAVAVADCRLSRIVVGRNPFAAAVAVGWLLLLVLLLSWIVLMFP